MLKELGQALFKAAMDHIAQHICSCNHPKGRHTHEGCKGMILVGNAWEQCKCPRFTAMG